MTTEFARILSELSDAARTEDDGGERHGHNVFALASLADCASPDTDDSPGARFLARIAQDVAEAIRNDSDNPGDVDPQRLTDGDGAAEIADSAVPVSTYEQWAVFVDLAAWQEDVTELGVDASDLTQVAGVALYMIAERLVNALAVELSEALDDDAETGERYETEQDGVQIGPRPYFASLDDLTDADA